MSTYVLRQKYIQGPYRTMWPNRVLFDCDNMVKVPRFYPRLRRYLMFLFVLFRRVL